MSGGYRLTVGPGIGEQYLQAEGSQIGGGDNSVVLRWQRNVFARSTTSHSLLPSFLSKFSPLQFSRSRDPETQNPFVKAATSMIQKKEAMGSIERLSSFLNMSRLPENQPIPQPCSVAPTFPNLTHPPWLYPVQSPHDRFAVSNTSPDDLVLKQYRAQLTDFLHTGRRERVDYTQRLESERDGLSKEVACLRGAITSWSAAWAKCNEECLHLSQQISSLTGEIQALHTRQQDCGIDVRARPSSVNRC